MAVNNKTNSENVKTAVISKHILSRRGISERFFTLLFSGFTYNQTWEDPRVDRKALKIGPESRVLTIASAGCNVLDYLIDKPESITAVDINQHHIYLTNLKIAAMSCLPSYEAFFDLFGRADQKANLENYNRYIRKNLDDPTRRFWDGGSFIRRSLMGPRARYFTKNFYSYGLLGLHLRLMQLLGKAVGCKAKKVLQGKSLEEQRQLFERYIDPGFEKWIVKFLINSSTPLLLSFLAISPKQWEQVKRQHRLETIRDISWKLVKDMACKSPIDENYFAWQAFSRRYDCKDRKAIPEYLKKENYDVLKSNIHRVNTRVASIQDFLREQPDNSLNRFVFLDAQDWMNESQVNGLWSLIARVGQPGSRIIFRTVTEQSPVDFAVDPEIRKRFTYHKEESLRLLEEERTRIYGGFHLYTLR